MPKRVEDVRFIMEGGRLREELVAEAISLAVRRLESVRGEVGESPPSSDGVVRPEKLISKGRRGVGRRSGGPSSDIAVVVRHGRCCQSMRFVRFFLRPCDSLWE